MRIAAAFWVLLGPMTALAAGNRQAPATVPAVGGLPTIVAPAPASIQTPAVLPGIPALALSAIPQEVGLQAHSLSPVKQISEAPRPNAASPEAIGVAAAAPAEAISAQAAKHDGEPGAQSAAAFDGFIKRGFELEYAIRPAPQGDTSLIPQAMYGAGLKAAAGLFGLSAPRYGPDDKHKLGHRQAGATDEAGRTWKAVPEEVDGRKYDGVEVITPPLVSKAEVERLALAHEETIAGALLVRGMSSSMHATYDVSHLIEPDGGASRLVDAILFIESNWAKIYAAASPARYGTIVNRFAAPLAVDHPKLLEELAAMPRAERTIDNVISLFSRYHEAETKRWGGHPGKAWKMRAANYGKLLGLQAGYEERPLPVIEFRIADLPEAAFLPKLSELFAALVTRAPPQDAFAPPFGAAADFREINHAIASQDPVEYVSFLRALELAPSDYPPLGRLGLAGGETVEEVALAALKAAASSALGLELAGPSSQHAAVALSLSGEAAHRRFAVSAAQAQDAGTARAMEHAALDDPDASVREAAIEQLVERGGEALWQALYKAAGDVSENVRYFVVNALYQLDDPRAAPLLRYFLAEKEYINRSWAWSALGRHSTAESAAVLAELMKSESEEVRDAAFKMLEIRSDDHALALRSQLLKDAIEAEKAKKAKEALEAYRALKWPKRAWLRLRGRAPEGA